jgi:endonuclease G
MKQSNSKKITWVSEDPIDLRKELISGVVDFQHPWFLRLGWERSRTVGMIPNAGTAFLIGKNVMMTNWHIFRRVDWALGKEVIFEYEQDSDGLIRATTKAKIRPDLLFFSDEELDFAIFKVEGEPGLSRGFLDVSTEGRIATDTRVNIVQHPNAELKKIAIRNNGLKHFDDSVLQYWTDTEHGSSGSPLFNDNWEFIGLHYMNDESNDVSGKPIIFNVGHRISAIWKAIQLQGIDISA